MNITKDIDEYRTIRYCNEQGQYHREDGPAIEWANGDKSWFLNGNRHREDGPAIEYANGDKSWYLDGKQITEQEFNNLMLKKRLKRILEL